MAIVDNVEIGQGNTEKFVAENISVGQIDRRHCITSKIRCQVEQHSDNWTTSSIPQKQLDTK